MDLVVLPNFHIFEYGNENGIEIRIDGGPSLKCRRGNVCKQTISHRAIEFILITVIIVANLPDSNVLPDVEFAEKLI